MDNQSNRRFQIKKDTFPVLLFFLVFFLYGCLVFQDYGISVDEMSQRDHSVLNYGLLVPSVRSINTDYVDFAGVEDLLEGSRLSQASYGVAIQLPMVFAEHLTGFTMPTEDMFRMRHFYTFFIFFLSAVCFYRCCRLFTENKWLALLGTAVYILNPRILADSFYNIKDLMGLSVCMMAVYFGCRMLKKMTQPRLILFAFFGALGTNVRIVLAVSIAAFLTAAFVQGIFEGEWKKRFLLCLEAGLFSIFFYFLMTPAIWMNTVENVQATVEIFSNYTTMPGTSVYRGSTVTGNDLSRTYVFVWILITTPIVYLLYMAVGAVKNFVEMVTCLAQKKKWGYVQIVWLALFLLAAIPFGYVLLVKPVIYNGWRHFYFMYSVMALAAFFGLLALEERLKDKGRLVWAGRGVLLAGILGTAVWIGINHPFEYVYFNEFARGSVEDNYDRDYWGMTSYQALQYLCDTVDDPFIKVYTYNGFSMAFLDEKDWERVIITDEEDADYVIENYQKGADTGLYLHYYYFDKLKDYEVDGFPICTIYRRVYKERGTVNLFQDQESGALMPSLNHGEMSWSQETEGRNTTLTGIWDKSLETDAFFMDTSWDDAVPGTKFWLSEDGEDWLCVNDLEGVKISQYAVQARLPETMELKYIRLTQELPEWKGGLSEDEKIAKLHITLYRRADAFDADVDQYESRSHYEKVMGHENSVYSQCAIDDVPGTRWETEENQKAQQIFDIFLDDVYPVCGLYMAYHEPDESYPRKLRVFVSEDNVAWKELAVTAAEDHIHYYFEQAPCKYMRLMTGDPGEELDCKWSITNLELLAPVK